MKKRENQTTKRDWCCCIWFLAEERVRTPLLKVLSVFRMFFKALSGMANLSGAYWKATMLSACGFFCVCMCVCKSLGWIPGDLFIINGMTEIDANWWWTKLKTTGDYRLAHLYVLKLTTIDWMISNNLLLSIYHAEFTVLIFLLK